MEEAVEPCRNSPGTPVAANADEDLARATWESEGDGRGEGKPPETSTSSVEGDRNAFTAADSVPGIREELADAREAAKD